MDALRRPDLRRGPLLWIQVAWGAMLIAFALGVPIYQAPDEPLHVDRVLDLAGRAGFQEHDQNTTGTAVARSMAIMGFDPRPAPFTSSNAPADPRPSFADLGGETSGTAVNQLNQHPPTYYAVVATVRTAITSMLPADRWPFDREVLLLRLLNLMMLLPVPALCALAASNLRWSSQRQWIAALFPLCIPQLAHIGSSVNNDNLLVLSASVALAMGAGLLVDGLEWRRGLLFAVAVALAMMTKATAVALLPLVVAVCWSGVRRRRSDATVAVAIAGLVAVSGWFYVRSLVLFGDPVASPRMLPRTDGSSFEPMLFVTTFLSRVAVSFWARFAVLWVEIPRPWVYLLSIVLVACVGLAVLRPGRAGLRVLMVPVGTLMLLFAAVSLRGHVNTGLFPGLQGRYMFVVLVALALAVVRGSELVSAIVARRVLIVVVVVNFVMSGVQIGRTFWGGGGLFGRLGSIADWSPVGLSGVVVLAMSVVVVLIAIPLAERSAAASDADVPQKGPV